MQGGVGPGASQGEVKAGGNRLGNGVTHMLLLEMKTVQHLVGAKTSVLKAQVWPEEGAMPQGRGGWLKNRTECCHTAWWVVVLV